MILTATVLPTDVTLAATRMRTTSDVRVADTTISAGIGAD
jgi:hypothetical protein